ncbi:MAG TPA: metallophosphoesterase family protein, partial [Vicinamibacterales bacterium]|nr:metallophosphoesterase family protein [Vicinamibacterales bacterium]
MRKRGSAPVPPFEANELPPKKVAWLNPWQLVRTAYHVYLSTVAVEFLDRRETLAALDVDRVPREATPDAVVNCAEVADAFVRVPADGLWIDYVADIGDSWEATYSIATLLVTPELRVRGHDHTLRPADIVVLGGDLVYPTPSRDGYRRRTRSALLAARPTPNGHDPGLFAIPGNHDWYDGLTNFVREFCQGQRIGGWSMFQRRSYFAVKLMPKWWLWGIDIALDTRIDMPQQAYFRKVMRDSEPAGSKRGGEEMFEAGDNIILCTAKPAWMDGEADSDAYRNLSYFVQEIVKKTVSNKKPGDVRVILAGDIHNYSRYQNKEGDQMITAGGGGSYLMGTHHLPRTIPDLRLPAGEPDLEGDTVSDNAKRQVAYGAADFPYPSRSVSWSLSLRTLLLAFRPANWPFVLFVGSVYWFLAWELRQLGSNVLTLSFKILTEGNVALTPAATAVFFTTLAVLITSAFVAAASNRQAWRWFTVPWGLAHGVGHLFLAVFLAHLIHEWPRLRRWADVLPFETGAVSTVFSIILILVGGVAGATLVGIYFVL